MKHEDFDDMIRQRVEIAEEHEQELFGMYRHSRKMSLTSCSVELSTRTRLQS